MGEYDNLPTSIEYRESIAVDRPIQSEWSEPKYQCPKCDGAMLRNEMVVLATYPPKYLYQCNKCGYQEYHWA